MSSKIMKFTAELKELKGMDELVFDEVEIVHEIPDKHKADNSAHTA